MHFAMLETVAKLDNWMGHKKMAANIDEYYKTERKWRGTNPPLFHT